MYSDRLQDDIMGWLAATWGHEKWTASLTTHEVMINTEARVGFNYFDQIQFQ